MRETVRIERPAANTAVVVLTGEHDLAGRPELDMLFGSLLAECRLVVADVSQAEFVDSTVLDLFIRTMQAASDHGRVFRVQVGTKAIVHRAFELTNALDVLDCAPTREEALRFAGDGTS